MSGCCSGARSVVIEASVLRVDGETCDRCNGTIDAVREATRQLEAELSPMNVRVSLIEHDAGSVPESNVVLINGKPIEAWIGGERVETDCTSCGDLLGESTCCGAVSVGDEVHESFTEQHIREAALAALGLAGECGCS